MFWWLFWGELMHRWVEPQPPRLRHRAPARAASSSARRRAAREPGSSAAVTTRPRRPALRLVCVDGVRIDRAAS
jgi:hypothetical protein